MIGVAGAPLYVPATETPAPWTAVGYGVERMVGVITQSLNGLKHIMHRHDRRGEPAGAARHRPDLGRDGAAGLPQLHRR